MRSDKDNMLSSAKQYSNAVAAAKKSCEAAAFALTVPESEIAAHWKGESGAAMVQALADVRMELVQLYQQLHRLELQMTAHTQSVYDSWPEEDADLFFKGR